MVYQFNQLRISVPVVGHCVKNLVYAEYVFQCHLLIMTQTVLFIVHEAI